MTSFAFVLNINRTGMNSRNIQLKVIFTAVAKGDFVVNDFSYIAKGVCFMLLTYFHRCNILWLSTKELLYNLHM